MLACGINEENMDYFRRYFVQETAASADMLLGVIDDEDENAACGGLAFTVDDEGIRILSLFIAEAKRGNGGASALLKCLEDYAEKIGAPGIRAVYRLTDKTRDFCRLLKSRGYVEDGQIGEGFSFRLSWLNRNKIVKVAPLTGGRLCPLGEISEESWDLFRLEMLSLRENNADGEKGVYPDIRALTGYDPGVSQVFLSPEGKIEGVILFSGEWGDHTLDYLWNRGNNLRTSSLLIKAAYEALTAEDPETRIFAFAAAKEAKKLIRLLSDGEPVPQRVVRQFLVV